jgi:NADPH2:quinone reductase
LWLRLATDLRPRHLDEIVTQTISLDDLPEAFQRMLSDKSHGRMVVEVQGTTAS